MRRLGSAVSLMYSRSCFSSTWSVRRRGVSGEVRAAVGIVGVPGGEPLRPRRELAKEGGGYASTLQRRVDVVGRAAGIGPWSIVDHTFGSTGPRVFPVTPQRGSVGVVELVTRPRLVRVTTDGVNPPGPAPIAAVLPVRAASRSLAYKHNPLTAARRRTAAGQHVPERQHPRRLASGEGSGPGAYEVDHLCMTPKPKA